MANQPIKFIPPKQARKLTELAERARDSLGKYAEQEEVNYGPVGLQLLDEWMGRDRHLQQFPQPSQEIITIWGAFLGETFRRKFEGEWAINMTGNKKRLGVICPKGDKSLVFIDVMDQAKRRVRDGMSASLSFYYMTKGVDIKSGE